MIKEADILAIGNLLNDEKRPLKERFRALFTLKNVGGALAIAQIERCFDDSSALLKHELAYCLGQMLDTRAIPVLTKVLADREQAPMVRHEAAEALGAIKDEDTISILEEYAKDPVVEVAETCQLALDRFEWYKAPKDQHVMSHLSKNPYASVDPAPPFESTDIKFLRSHLLNESDSLFNRYRAMFSLRNMRDEEATLAITEGLKGRSALFRHEIAFVLGQLQDEVTVPYLRASLEDREENEMVRHECAEALGAIASPECFEILKQYVEDEKRVVRESCVIALDMCEYENSSEFQYANALSSVKAAV